MKRAKLIEPHKLQEIPDMDEPSESDWNFKKREYEDQLDACRTFDAPDFKGIVGDVYEEGKDYKINDEYGVIALVDDGRGGLREIKGHVLTAIPIQQPASEESEDELGAWLYKKFEEYGIYDTWADGERNYKDTKQSAKEIANELKSQFAITRKGG